MSLIRSKNSTSASRTVKQHWAAALADAAEDLRAAFIKLGGGDAKVTAVYEAIIEFLREQQARELE